MEASAVLGTKATGHRRLDGGQELEGSAMNLAQRASRLIMYISMDRPDQQFSSKTVMSTIAKLLEIAASKDRDELGEQASAGVHLWRYQREVTECMAFGDSDWAGDCESRQSTTAVLEKQGKPVHRYPLPRALFQTHLEALRALSALFMIQGRIV